MYLPLLGLLLISLLATPATPLHLTRRILLQTLPLTSLTSLSPLSPPTSPPRYIDTKKQMQISDGGTGPNSTPRTTGVLTRRFTGESTPFLFQKKPLPLTQKWTKPFPTQFTATDFTKADQHQDSEFYVVPRFVYHIDEGAVAALTNYYKDAIKDGSEVLDVCSSWVSHYPVGFEGRMKRVAGTGLNRMELEANEQFTERGTVLDFNKPGEWILLLPPSPPPCSLLGLRSSMPPRRHSSLLGRVLRRDNLLRFH